MTFARHLVHYYLSINRGMTLEEIGAVTQRDHCTVRTSVDRIEDYQEVYPNISAVVQELGNDIKWLYQLNMEVKNNEITGRQIRYLYFLLDQLGIRHLKHDLVLDACDGRTDSARELSQDEMRHLVTHLEQKLQQARREASPGKEAIRRMDRMRKRILSMCYSIGWVTYDINESRHKVDMERLGAWLLKYGYLHKPLNDYTYLELPGLVTQVENLMRSVLEGKSKSERL